MKVLYFGTYERDYPRNAQVISCLRRAGVDVRERHVPLWEGNRRKYRMGASALSSLLVAQARLRMFSGADTDADVIVVGYPGHLDMRAAKRVARGRPIAFNPLVSLEDTLVADRRLVPARSVVARAIRRADRDAFRGADLVVADTEAHARYFRERFDLPEAHLAVCFVGAEDRLFVPGQRNSTSFEALFVGKLIPLHGMETILAAAALCPEIPFRVVGSGQLDHLLATRPANVRWVPWVDYGELPGLYRAAGCALGIFDRGEKAARVIPNKVFQSLATATPVITADTPAARELLQHERDALLVPPGDAVALADAIRRLAADSDLGERLGSGGRATYDARATEEVLGGQWRSNLERLLG